MAVLAKVFAAMLTFGGAPPDDGAQPRSTIAVVEALQVDAGATCLAREQLAAHLIMWLERDHVDAGLAVDVTGDPNDPHAVTFVIARDAVRASPRVLRGIPDDCHALHAAVSLAIAVAVDTSVWDANVRAAPPMAPTPDVPIASGPDRAATPSIVPPTRPGPGGLVRVGGSLALGITDGVAYGANLGAILRLRRRLDLELAGAAVVGPHGSFAGGRVRNVLGHIDARVCGRLEPRLAVVRACLATGVGAMQLSGRTYAQGRTTTVPWLALGPSFDVATPRTTRIAFAAQLELWVSVLRTNMVALDDAGVAVATERLPRVGATLSFGPIFRLR